jgi:hypothetical protein
MYVIKSCSCRSKMQYIKPGIDCTQLLRKAMFVALPRKVNTMLPCAAEWTLPRANLAHIEPNWSGFFVPRQRDVSVLCSFSSDSLVSEEQRRSTAAPGCRPSMLDTNTVNKRMNFPRMNSCTQQPCAIDTQLNGSLLPAQPDHTILKPQMVGMLALGTSSFLPTVMFSFKWSRPKHLSLVKGIIWVSVPIFMWTEWLDDRRGIQGSTLKREA